MLDIILEPSEIKIYTPIIKTKIKLTQGWIKNLLIYNTFTKHKVSEKTILITEANYTHSEVIPSYIKYFSELGYNIDVLLTENNLYENPFVKLDVKANFYYVSQAFYDKCILSDKIKEYEYVLFTSNQVYLRHGDISSVFDVYKKIQHPKKDFIVSEHHLEMLNEDDYERSKIIALPIWAKNFDKRIEMVNPCYFYPVKTNYNKNTTTRFVVIGKLAPSRKNMELFNETFSEILNNKIAKFELVVLGDADMKYFQKSLVPYINIKGHVNFDTMYKELEKSDFILPLFDPEMNSHNRYIERGTSGSFQLCYGFRKPMVIASKFAEPNLLNNKNSIIYYKNSDFKNAVLEAIKMNDSDYANLVQNLDSLYKSIYSESLNNLRELVNNEDVESF